MRCVKALLQEQDEILLDGRYCQTMAAKQPRCARGYIARRRHQRNPRTDGYGVLCLSSRSKSVASLLEKIENEGEVVDLCSSYALTKDCQTLRLWCCITYDEVALGAKGSQR
jgi:hypothetical protein